MQNKIPRALTIAGSDSGGGAGIQADLKTFTALKVYGLSVITSVTAQNTVGISSIHDLPTKFIESEFDTVMNDIGCDAAKIGMLSNKKIIQLIDNKIKKYKIKKTVLDPVMVSKSGTKLLKDSAISTLIRELIPEIHIITPNIPEAEVLSEIKIKNVGDIKKAAEKIKKLGCDHVLIKGGHLNTPDAVDILYDGKNFIEFKSKKIKTKNTHGTGCTYSAAICSELAKGNSVVDSVKSAKIYVTKAIKNSLNIGKGHGPLNHFWAL